MRGLLRRFALDQSGGISTEYAIIAAVIALGLVASGASIRDGLNNILNNAAKEIDRTPGG